ncbi:MAG: UbiA prenyltransferase family protein [Deltaproteobacteria bacterium]|nr:UbiA prenyltransferase family protein [Deltaproteobacteria bacterium]
MTKSRARAYLDLIRVPHYLKNLLIGMPLFFGHKLFDPQAAWATWWAFAVFCLTASLVYVFNDLRDVEFDRRHPKKRLRPLASGNLTPGQAYGLMAILLGLALVLALLFVSPRVMGLIAIYLVLNLAYSWRLKQAAVVDVIFIGLFFVLRVFVGGLAAGVWVSHWLVLMTFLLALFLALAKRRDDLVLAENGQTRPSIDGYNLEFVSASLTIMAAVIVVCYVLYTLSPEVMAKHGTGNLYLTVFWVLAGLLRYLQLTLVKQESGSPTMVLLKDKFLLATVVLWVVNLFVVLYVLG